MGFRGLVRAPGVLGRFRKLSGLRVYGFVEGWNCQSWCPRKNDAARASPVTRSSSANSKRF